MEFKKMKSGKRIVDNRGVNFQVGLTDKTTREYILFNLKYCFKKNEHTSQQLQITPPLTEAADLESSTTLVGGSSCECAQEHSLSSFRARAGFPPPKPHSTHVAFSSAHIVCSALSHRASWFGQQLWW